MPAIDGSLMVAPVQQSSVDRAQLCRLGLTQCQAMPAKPLLQEENLGPSVEAGRARDPAMRD